MERPWLRRKLDTGAKRGTIRPRIDEVHSDRSIRASGRLYLRNTRRRNQRYPELYSDILTIFRKLSSGCRKNDESGSANIVRCWSSARALHGVRCQQHFVAIQIQLSTALCHLVRYLFVLGLILVRFAPCYPQSSPRYSFGNTDYVYILFQPEYSFSYHEVAPPSDPNSIRHKIRENFKKNGREFYFPRRSGKSILIRI